MQIPQDLPQFKEQKTLIIVSGTHEARYMLAHQGNIEDIDQFKKEKITYSDREGHFLKRAFGRVFGSGSVYEQPKERELIEFAEEFEKHTKKVISSTDPDSVILASPDYAENIILGKMSNDSKDKILLTLKGNYYKMSIPDILERIKKEMEKNTPPEIMSEEAKKILEKGRS